MELPQLPDLKRARRKSIQGLTTERKAAADLLADSIIALIRYGWAFSSGTRFWTLQDTHLGRYSLRKETAVSFNTTLATVVQKLIDQPAPAETESFDSVKTSVLANTIEGFTPNIETEDLHALAQFFCEKWVVELQVRFKRQMNSADDCPKASEGVAPSWPGLILSEWRLNCFAWFRVRAISELHEQIRLAHTSFDDAHRRSIFERLNADNAQETEAIRRIGEQINAEEQREADERAAAQRREETEREAQLERAEKINILLAKYNDGLARDYIGTASATQFGSDDVALEPKVRHAVEESFVQKWLGNPDNISLKTQLTREQIRVISRITGKLLVRARAGSGKTTTIVARVLFLIRHCGMAPETILLFAFNKKAAQKLERDLVIALGIENLPPDEAVQRLPVVQTFDGFAGSISGVDPLGKTEFYGLFQDGIEDLLARDEESVKSAMLHFFRAEWAHVKSGVLPGRESVLEERRSESALFTFAGEQVKSRGEHRIANWLFEHDIPYTYERPVRQIEARWIPDFTLLPDSTMPILVEYLGLQGELDYDRKTEWKKQRLTDMPEDKRPSAVWLEPSSTESQQGTPPSFIATLTVALDKHHKSPKKLTDDQIWQKIKHSAMPQFRKLTSDVAVRAKQLRVSSQELAAAAQSTAVPQLLQLCADVMRYADSNNRTGKRTHAEICWAAGDKLKENGSKSKDLRSQGEQYRPIDINNFQEVIIDEFQDYSRRFKAVVDGVLSAAPNARLFVVGDDWQAINRFAGSEPRFITSWADAELALTINHRSLPEIVELGNSVMPNRGPIGQAKQSSSRATVLRMKLGDLKTTAIELSAVRAFTTIQPQVVAAVCRLALPHLRAQQSVAVLGHTNYEVDVVKSENVRTESPLKGLLLKLANLKSGHIDVDTVHGVKGQEADVVVLLADGFPLLHPHRVIFEVFGDTEPELLEDERRLLYVGITRAKHTLYVLTGVKERKTQWANDLAMSDGSWEHFPPVGLHVEESDRLAVVLSGTATKGMKDQVRAAGFKWMGRPSWSWERLVADKSQPTPEAILVKLRNEPWFPSGDIDGVLTIEVVNGQREVLGREVLYPASSTPRLQASATDDLPF
jgi:DNA helicase-4